MSRKAGRELLDFLPALRSITIKQVLDAGTDAIIAAGINPWCIKEGLATGDERALNSWKIEQIAESLQKILDQNEAMAEALGTIARTEHRNINASRRLEIIYKEAATALAAIKEPAA
jgi:hypothetical protein